MRIAVIGPLEFPSAQGGMTRHCEEVYSRLARRGHDVTVYCHSSEVASGDTYEGMRIRRVRSVRVPGWERLGYAFVSSVSALGKRFDVVHYHSFSSSGFCFLPRLRRRTKVVVTVHRLEWQDEKWGFVARTFLRWSERAATRFANALITVSRNFEEYLRGRYRHVPPIRYVPNGVPPPRDVGPEAITRVDLTPGRYALFVGRVVPEKGVHVAFDAFEQLHDLVGAEGWSLAVVGGERHSAEYAASLRARADQPGSHVRLLGIRSGDDLAALYRHAGLFVAPSFHEGQPLTVLEAMSYGRAIVASDIPAHRELVADTGVLFAAGDAADLARVLRRLITKPDETRELGARAGERMRATNKFDWDHVADETEAVLSSLA